MCNLFSITLQYCTRLLYVAVHILAESATDQNLECGIMWLHRVHASNCTGICYIALALQSINIRPGRPHSSPMHTPMQESMYM